MADAQLRKKDMDDFCNNPLPPKKEAMEEDSLKIVIRGELERWLSG